MINWINVYNKRPEEKTIVLVYYVDPEDDSYEGIGIGVMFGEEWDIYHEIKGDEYYKEYEVTHWAPLTELNFPKR
jgi:hypothetical protein